MSATIKCVVPKQAGFEDACTAEFNSAGIMLIIDGLDLGVEAPDDFLVEIEGSEFAVRREGEEHVISSDLREAFVAMFYG